MQVGWRAACAKLDVVPGVTWQCLHSCQHHCARRRTTPEGPAGTVSKCELFKDRGTRQAVACAGQPRTCWAQVEVGGKQRWLPDHLCTTAQSTIAERNHPNCQGGLAAGQLAPADTRAE